MYTARGIWLLNINGNKIFLLIFLLFHQICTVFTTFWRYLICSTLHNVLSHSGETRTSVYNSNAFLSNKLLSHTLVHIFSHHICECTFRFICAMRVCFVQISPHRLFNTHYTTLLAQTCIVRKTLSNVLIKISPLNMVVSGDGCLFAHTAVAILHTTSYFHYIVECSYINF